MSSKPWYRWFVGDARAKMAGLSLVEQGAYRALLDECYMRGGPLPADPDELARIAGAHTPAERQAVHKVVTRFFTRQGDQILNSRAAKEIAYIKQQSAAGKAGAAAKWDSEPHGESHSEHNGETNDGANGEQPGETMAPYNQIPDTIEPQHQNPEKTLRALTLAAPDSAALQPHRGASRKAARKPPSEPIGSQTWIAYANAYLHRYGIDPPRNARANALCLELVKRLGSIEAPQVAAHYVTLDRAPYLEATHPLTLLTRDAEALRTAWATGKSITRHEASAADRTASTHNAFEDLLSEALQEHRSRAN